MISLIIKKIKKLPKFFRNEENCTEYSNYRTIKSLSRFWYGVMRLKKNFEHIKYGKGNISIDDIVNTVFDLLFKKNTEEIKISENINIRRIDRSQ